MSRARLLALGMLVPFALAALFAVWFRIADARWRECLRVHPAWYCSIN